MKLRFLNVFAFVGLLFGVLASSFAAKPPMRFLLDEEFSWMDRRSADRFVDTAKRAGFNALVPCVWHGRGVTWQSRLPKEPRWENNPDALSDPLAYLISRAHEKGLEVHPWFTVVKRQRDFYPEWADKGVPDDAFDVHNRNFQLFIRDVILEVVRGYDIDGVNLDYMRSRGVCVSESCQADYRARTGRNVLVDDLARRLSSEARVSIENWNARPVNALLESISTSVRQARPGTLLTVSSHAGYEPLRLEGTNSIQWANTGLIDYILHMDYAREPELRRDLLGPALKALKDPARLILLMGNYEFEKGNASHVWSREPDLVKKVLAVGVSFNPAQSGIALYEYRFLNDGQVSAIRSVLAPNESAQRNQAL